MYLVHILGFSCMFVCTIIHVYIYTLDVLTYLLRLLRCVAPSR